MDTIKDNQILHKIIELQACMIQGRHIKTLLHRNIDFYLEKSGADIITIYMHEEEQVNTDYILEKHRMFAHLLKKYVLDKNNFKWEKFVKNCDKHFISKIKHDNITELYQIFKGFLSKKEATAFTNELKMKNAIMMPMYEFDNKVIIGYVCFVFQSHREVDIEKLDEVKTSFQIILQPLYNRDNNTFFTKCVRIDEDMKLLTPQEKKIVRKVLEGIPYPEVAAILDISINTLKTHMKNIFNKYNVNSKIELYNKFNTYI
ncbi:MAG: LuxR C-terminal-related transcriptional regulator [Sulfurovum sp.]|nr:LuxR C-terminal-related transcriptional regulator [Sulfurovum sp.]